MPNTARAPQYSNNDSNRTSVATTHYVNASITVGTDADGKPRRIKLGAVKIAPRNETLAQIIDHLNTDEGREKFCKAIELDCRSAEPATVPKDDISSLFS